MTPEIPKEAGTNPWLLVLFLAVSLLGTIIGGAGGVELIRAITRRKPKTAVATANQIELAKQTQLYAEQLEADARQARESEQKAWIDARHQATEAWRQADETQQKLAEVNRRLDETMYRLHEVGRYLDALVSRVQAQNATIEDIQTWINTIPPPPVTILHNGKSLH